MFQPEGREDLTIFDRAGVLLEDIQVKAFQDNLTISTFDPGSNNSFFQRALKTVKEQPQAAIRIVSFGPIGPEMSQAWQADGRERQVVQQKLLEYKYSASEIDLLFRSIELSVVSENELNTSIFKFISESLAGISREDAFDLLVYWLFLASEKREKITHGVLTTRLTNVGRFLAERAAYHQEWFKTIHPIAENPVEAQRRQELRAEFYQGTSARYEHILADLDVRRDTELQQIADAFQNNYVVIIHSASGQGKSTLAYRYLHDFYPETWRFEVRSPENTERARNIALALSGHANAVGVPLIIYLDVRPNDKNWTDLLPELSQNPYVRLLVTVREEDFRRASISRAHFQFGEIELAFTESVGRRIYSGLSAFRTSERFLSFEVAWRQFGSEGPLLEFVYLVTQNELLYERLRQQVRNLEDSVRTGQLQPGEFELLRLVSVASAFEARVNLRALVEKLRLPAPRRTLELFEQEYLLRRTSDGRYVEGLHPIRSAILVDLLTDPTVQPWAEVARGCIPLIVENDLEDFLLFAFSRRSAEVKHFLDTLGTYRPNTWTGIAGLLRSLLWLGIKDYVTENKPLIDQAFERVGSGWWLMLDFDITNASVSDASHRWTNLSPPEQMIADIGSLREHQSPRETVYSETIQWLKGLSGDPQTPESQQDWIGVADVSFWSGFLDIDCPIVRCITETDLNRAIDTLPLECLCDVVYGLTVAQSEHLQVWSAEHRLALVERFRHETKTVMLEDDGETIRAHFIVDLEQHSNSKQEIAETQSNRNYLHNEAIRRVEMLRKLFFDRQRYGCQGYGQNLGSLTLPFDDTRKTGIPAEYLLPTWATQLNSVFRNLGTFNHRPATWLEHAQNVEQLRQVVSQNFRGLNRALGAHFRKKNAVNLLRGYIDAEVWDQLPRMANRFGLLPQCAVDEWGFIGEGATPKTNNREQKSHQKIEVRLGLHEHQAYSETLRDFTSSVVTFGRQAVHVLAINPSLGRAKTPDRQISIRQEAAKQGLTTDLDRLTFINLSSITKTLPGLQTEFRRRFSRFYQSDLLERLERQEQGTYEQTWALWYQFAYHPDRVWQDAGKEASRKVDDALTRIRKRIRKMLRELQQVDIRAGIVSEIILWGNERALWITFDISDPRELHTAFSHLEEALDKVIQTIRKDQLDQSVLGAWWQTVIIIPLIQGKALSKLVWTIPVHAFASSSPEKNWWDYIQHPVPDPLWDSLGTLTWIHPRLELIHQFQSAVVDLSLLVAHVADFASLPELDEEGEVILQEHLTSYSSRINNALNQASLLVVEIVHFFTALSPEQQLQRETLRQGVSLLSEIWEDVLPLEDPEGHVSIRIPELKIWSESLEATRTQSELVRLCWISDVLENETPRLE